jgi:multidrug efflux pump subunit AcrA (membrane-fusion protein)
MDARITLDAYPNDPLTGKVTQILFEGKNVSNVITYDVKVQPDRVPAFFRSQMTANVSFIVQHRDDALLLPSAAVKDNGDGSKVVMVPGADGATENRTVTTGVDNGQSVEILSGIDEGQNVLIVSRRYVPQKGEQNSPLTMGGPRQNKGGGSGGGGGGGGNRGR